MNRIIKNILFIQLFLLLAFTLNAQKRLLYKADNFLNVLAYARAIPLYEEVIEKHDDASAKIKLAECYKNLNYYDKAEFWYKQVINSTGALDDSQIINYAQILKSNRKYEEAKQWFLKYAKTHPDEPKVNNLISSCDIAKQIIEDSFFYIIEPMFFNTSASELSPAFYSEGLAFLSNRKDNQLIDKRSGNPLFDLYYVETKDNKDSSEIMEFPSTINSKQNESQAAFNHAYNIMYITRNNPKNKKKTIDRYQILKVELIKDKWKVIEKFPHNSDDYSVGYPSLSHAGMTLSKAGRKLYFVSNMPGGYGGSDIYVSYRQGYTTSKLGGTWSTPENLGSAINTEGDELYPYIHPDGTLYFSSNGHAGLGGFDIFYANLINDNWIEPRNLGYPINSSKDDYGYITYKNKGSGYFSSNRKSGGLDFDIFYFEKTIPEFVNCDTMNDRSLCVMVYEVNTYAIDTLPLIYEWAMGDGSVIRGNYVEYCYMEPGIYNLQLNVIDSITNETMINVASYELIVENKPEITITSPDTIMIDSTVLFDAAGSLIDICNLDKYYWTFDDKYTIEGKKVIYSFNKPGAKYIRLGVYGKDPVKKNKCFGCITKKIIVEESH